MFSIPNVLTSKCSQFQMVLFPNVFNFKFLSNSCFHHPDLSLSGSFMLRDYTKTKIPAQSCLTVELKEIYSCNEEEGCRNPYISETRIDVANQEMFRVGKQSFKTPYGALFRNVVGSKFEVRAILNVGWCRHYVKGKRRTRPNDYWTNQVYELSFDEKEDDAYLHLEMSKVEKSLGQGNSIIYFHILRSIIFYSILLTISCKS